MAGSGWINNMPAVLRYSGLVFAIIFAAQLAVSPAHAAREQKTLDAWMDSELIPSVVSRLNSLPRFNNDVVRFVVLDQGKPSALTNGLAIALRDKLQDAVIDQSDVRVAWQVDRQKFDRYSEQSRVDCTTNDVHYFIALELQALRSGKFEVTVRALDVDEQKWVPGFSEVWHGTLTTMQQRAYRQPESDQAFLGQRTVPFDDSQTDLLAAQLAHDLGCSLLREMSGEYVANKEAGDAGSAGQSAELLSLITNNLAAYQALQITQSESGSNSAIQINAHAVDDDLYQYWVTVSPTDPDSELPTVSASAYIYLPEKYLPASLVSAGPSAGIGNGSDLIDSTKIVRTRSEHFCESQSSNSRRVYSNDYSVQGSSCFALQATTRHDSVAFFLYHQMNNGLVRLAGDTCGRRTEARIARKGEPVLYPLGINGIDSPSWLPAEDWLINPDADTYYVIASQNSKAARALSKHFETLPQRCGDSLRPGLEGAELRRWFRELNAIAAHWQNDIDWQSVRVKNVF